MKLFALLVYSRRDVKPVLLSSAKELSTFGYFNHSAVSESIVFTSRTIVARTHYGQRQTIFGTEPPLVYHVYVRDDGLAGVAITDNEYRVAFKVINRMLNEYETVTGIGWHLAISDSKEDSPHLWVIMKQSETDKLQSSLDEVTGIVKKNIRDILRRGESLEDLDKLSQELSKSSAKF